MFQNGLKLGLGLERSFGTKVVGKNKDIWENFIFKDKIVNQA